MKTITCTSNFKQVIDKKSPRFGEKRPSMDWTFEGFEAQDIVDCTSHEEAEKLATLVNAKIEDFGRKLVLQNNDNWEYSPTGTLSLDAVYADLTAETTRKRKVTKETLDKCASFYEQWAPEIGKSSAAASAGARAIREKLVPIAGNITALERMKANVMELLEYAESEGAGNIALSEGLENNMDCLEWLVAQCESLAEESKEITADAL